MSTATKLIVQSHSLWFLTLTYSMIIVMSNWFDARLIEVMGVVTDGGTLVFPLTFLLSDLITEVYGYKYARLAIWCGFLFNAIFVMYGQIIIHLPSPDFATNNTLFDTLLKMNTRILLASTISYLSAEPINSMIMAKMKIKWQGKYLGLRFVVSTVFASALDSLLFGSIAFYGTISNPNLIRLIITMWVIKVLIEIVGLPISIRLANFLKRKDGLDIYDTKTKFNLFTFDTQYTSQDNAFIR